MKGFPEDIFELSAAHKEMAAELSSAVSLPDRYILKDEHDAVRGFAGYLKIPSDEGSGTAAAFSAYFLGRTGLLQDRRVSVDSRHGIALQVMEKCIDALTKELIQVEALPPERQTLTNYKLPIYVAGALTLARLSLLNVTEQTNAALNAGVTELCNRLRIETRGALTRIGRYSSSEPSAYYTYWAVQGLVEALNSPVLHLSEEDRQAAGECLAASRQWSERALAALIADHHAGINSRFDPIELVCVAAMATLALPSHNVSVSDAAPSSPSDEAIRLTIHGLALLFDNYFNEGSFARSRPVYSDEEKNSIFCSTAEALFYLLAPGELHLTRQEARDSHARRLATLKPHLPSLLSAFRLLRRNRNPDGYVPDLDGSFGVQPRPNAFSTVSALCFMELVAYTVDDVLDHLARAALRVPEFAIDHEVRSRQYPDALGKILSHYVVAPLNEDRRNDAYYSMILHGPPGTAKTTLAKKLAQDIEWPILEITQRDFLMEGTPFIDAAADRIFRLVGLLKNVVVLFDELEELIGSRESTRDGQQPERESRLLTTSMLPRIHDLRDKSRIVFIFATNRIHSFDNAATRPGRFDIIQLVPHPEVSGLKIYLNKLYDNRFPTNAPSSKKVKHIKSLVRKVSLAQGMTYKNVELFFNELVRQVTAEGQQLDDENVSTLIKNFTSIDDGTITHFKGLSENHDRP